HPELGEARPPQPSPRPSAALARARAPIDGHATGADQSGAGFHVPLVADRPARAGAGQGALRRAPGLRGGAPPLRVRPAGHLPAGTLQANGITGFRGGKGFGAAKAKFLLEEKLPRAFALGEDLGIRFRMERRIVHTVDVNTALALAQRLGSPAAEGFALASLRAHFEELQDPNEAAGLRKRLQDVGVPLEALEAALSDPEKESKNALRTAQARPMLRSGVPHFEIRCGGPDLCEGVHGGPTRPSYFEEIFQRCLPKEEL
ncbi:unnamed protein product, partial [Effrenium voratum]